MIKTTVVIPNHNGIEYLGPCLDSLADASENGSLIDVIVVDNGSDDSSVQFVKEYGKTAVKLIELSHNTGFAYAVNRGIEAADTEYVLLLNNDVTVKLDFISELEQALDGDERIFAVNPLMLQMHEPELIDSAGDYYCALGWAYAGLKGKKAGRAGDSKKPVFSACAGASIYRKKLFDGIGLFDEEHFAYLEDVDIGYRARINGYRSVFCPSAVCFHAGSAHSGSRYNEFKISLASKNSIYIIYKNMPFLQFILNLPFLIVGFAIKTLFFSFKGYGATYLRGLAQGFKLCFSEKGKSHKVRFKLTNLANYIVIQLELWVNIIRRLFV